MPLPVDIDTTWDLGILFDSFDDPRFEEAFNRAERLASEALDAVGAFTPTGEAATDVANLESSLRLFQNLLDPYYRVSAYISLILATDAANERATALQDREMQLRNVITRLQSALCRYAGSLKDLDALIAGNPFLEEHAFLLHESARQAEHVLPPDLEPTVLRLQMNGGQAFANLHDLLDGTHLVDMEQDGKPVRLPLSQVRGMAYDPDPAVRKAAYEAELASYAKIEIPMAACLNAIKGEAQTICELRGYPSVLEETLANQRMDRSALDALLTAMEESLPDFRRYLRAKARVLGHGNGLPFYDLFAPVGTSSRRFTYEESHEYLVEILSRFSRKMADFVDHAYRNRWIDVYPRPGKGGGAFCATIPPVKASRVLTNFEGSFSSVSTIAHELGHAYHGDCLKDGSILNSDYPMPLAETASIFNETLVAHSALEDADEEESFALLDNELLEATQVIVDILSRYRFETAVIEARRERGLNVGELREMMLEAQRSTYGDGLDPDTMHPYMWACKSHYYSVDLSFYNWPYAFGLLFGRGVYARYLAEGEAFLPEYDRLLERTGRDTVAGVAASVGIDVCDPAFWRSALDTIRVSIDRFEALAAKRTPA